jgi:predicted nucleic acid-binding protein
MPETIVSDTSCLIVLSKTGLLDILQKLFKQISITEEVNEEFNEPLPSWIKLTNVTENNRINELSRMLDRGEASAIALALQLPDALLIIDDLKGRNIALSLNIRIIGTMGVILLAYKNGFIKDLKKVLLDILDADFRVSSKLIKTILDEI